MENGHGIFARLLRHMPEFRDICSISGTCPIFKVKARDQVDLELFSERENEVIDLEEKAAWITKA